MDSFVAMYASGEPVTLLANAELLDIRELTSITRYSSDFGCSAHWMLHSPTIPKLRIVFIDVERIRWYSRFVNVCEGAMTMESPVWTPIGSKFSMLQIVRQLSA